MNETKRRVYNESARCYLTYAQATSRIEDGVCAWVEFNRSIRVLTLAEMMAERSRRAAMLERLPLAELPRVVVRGIDDLRQEMATAWEGTQFERSMLADLRKAAEVNA